MAVAELIRSTRIAQGLTQQELGELIGVSKSGVSMLENPDRGWTPAESTLIRLAEWLDRDVNELLLEEKQIPRLYWEPVSALLLRVMKDRGMSIAMAIECLEVTYEQQCRANSSPE